MNTMDKNAIYQTKLSLIRHDLGGALHTILPLLEDRDYARLHDPITQIGRDYELMLSYLRQGYPDPARDKMYCSLLRKLDRCVNDAALIQRTQKDPRQNLYASKSKRFTLSKQEVAKRIEGHVSEIALLSLESSNDQRLEELYKSHHELVSMLFEHLCFSPQWHKSDQEFYESLILSPTIDITDAAVLTSAITLAVITHFDIHKYLTLAHIYQRSDDEQLRQRALVGWALTTTRTHSLYEEVKPLVDAMTHDEETSQQLLETQMQIILCMNAEQDQETITHDIMPNIMKNNGFNITRNGIVEKEDDPMQDILDPDASDRKMEELEKSFQRMSEMQRSGSDIYFGGFSKMKRYPFFYTLSNWFTPFYVDHPGLSGTRDKLQGKTFLNTLMKSGPFCDSDKYSFALAMSTIIDKIPENMKSLLNDGASFGPIASDEFLQSPANIRLMYLQDLYRFFRLSDQRICFFNPFGEEKSGNCLFLTSDILISSVKETDVLRLGNELLKHHQHTLLKALLTRCGDQFSSSRMQILKGQSALHQGQYADAIAAFHKAINEMPDSKRALIGLARAATLTGDYHEAAEAYQHLHELAPDNSTYSLSLAILLIKEGKAADALQILYKLHYEDEDNLQVIRVLAWVLLALQKTEQASKNYTRLIDSGQLTPEDHLNIGYCQWIKGDITSAISYFKHYMEALSATPQILMEEFEKDEPILQANGITHHELHMMVDLLR